MSKALRFSFESITNKVKFLYFDDEKSKQSVQVWGAYTLLCHHFRSFLLFLFIIFFLWENPFRHISTTFIPVFFLCRQSKSISIEIKIKKTRTMVPHYWSISADDSKIFKTEKPIYMKINCPSPANVFKNHTKQYI